MRGSVGFGAEEVCVAVTPKGGEDKGTVGRERAGAVDGLAITETGTDMMLMLQEQFSAYSFINMFDPMYIKKLLVAKHPGSSMMTRANKTCGERRSQSGILRFLLLCIRETD